MVYTQLSILLIKSRDTLFKSFTREHNENWKLICPPSFTAPVSLMLLRLWLTIVSFCYRTKGSVMNFPEFAKAFNCRTGSSMNPVHKCTVWWWARSLIPQLRGGTMNTCWMKLLIPEFNHLYIMPQNHFYLIVNHMLFFLKQTRLVCFYILSLWFVVDLTNFLLRFKHTHLRNDGPCFCYRWTASLIVKMRQFKSSWRFLCYSFIPFHVAFEKKRGCD